jgi:hypothetical protein
MSSRASVPLRLALVIGALGAGACKRPAPNLAPDPTVFHPSTENHAVTISDAGRVHIDPVARTSSPEEAAKVPYMCSRCYKTVPQAEVHVIPWYDDSERDYVTTFLCDADFHVSLEETRHHVSANANDAADRARFAAFFERHQLPGVDAASPAYKHDALAILDKIEKRTLVVSP